MPSYTPYWLLPHDPLRNFFLEGFMHPSDYKKPIMPSDYYLGYVWILNSMYCYFMMNYYAIMGGKM